MERPFFCQATYKRYLWASGTNNYQTLAKIRSRNSHATTILVQKLRRLLLAPFTWLAAIVFLIEEAIWDWTAKLMARLGAVRFVRAIELRIAALPPRWALFTFLLPSLIIVPAKLAGLHAMAAGHWLIGGSIFVLAKFAGMALFSRIFNLTRPTLLQLGWFARLYAIVMHYRNRIHDYLDRWQAYQLVKQRIAAMIAGLKTSFKRAA